MSHSIDASVPGPCVRWLLALVLASGATALADVNLAADRDPVLEAALELLRKGKARIRAAK